MQLHHIIPESEGGPDTISNCIPLCLLCHAEVGSYNPLHPIGRKFSEDELRRHRDVWFEFVENHPERLSTSADSFFRPVKQDKGEPVISGWVEPFYEEATIWTRDRGNETKEVFHARVRNRGSNTLFVETIGFTAGEKRYPGIFSRWSSERKGFEQEVLAGQSAVFMFFGFRDENQAFDPFDGMYLITGTGDIFVNRKDSLERLLRESFRQRC
jgi:hypothetical protein